jgi:hypothetical protein
MFRTGGNAVSSVTSRRVTALITAAVLMWIPGGVAGAHTASTWYPSKWTTRVVSGVHTDRNVNWRFVTNVPTGDGTRNAVRFGAGQWTAQRQSLRFVQSSGPSYRTLQWGTCSAKYQIDKVGWERIDGAGDILAQTSKCLFSSDHGVLFNFKMRYDSAEPWYKGTSATIPSNRYDLRSVATHEFGHAGGFTPHWDSAGPTPLCPGAGSAQHTMCATLQLGSVAWRSLAEHDRHTFASAY